LNQASETAAQPCLSVDMSTGPASLPTANGTPLVLPRGMTSIKMMATIGGGLTRNPDR
jgi:hypothetical protein